MTNNKIEFRKGVFATKNEASIWTWIRFNEACQEPGTPGTVKGRALGMAAANSLLFERIYTIDGEPLDRMKMVELQLTMSEFNTLLGFALDDELDVKVNKINDVEVTQEIISNDEETPTEIDVTEATDFIINGNHFVIKPIPWEYSQIWWKDCQVSVAQAYKNIMMRYFLCNDVKLTSEQIMEPPPTGLGIIVGRILFDVAKKKVT